TPSEAQGPGSYSFQVRVTDYGCLYEEQTLTTRDSNLDVWSFVLGVPASVTIDEEAPYTFTATATDHDLPANTLSYSLIGAPAGEIGRASCREIRWTPSEAEGTGRYSLTVRVTDGGGLAK